MNSYHNSGGQNTELLIAYGDSVGSGGSSAVRGNRVWMIAVTSLSSDVVFESLKANRSCSRHCPARGDIRVRQNLTRS